MLKNNYLLAGLIVGIGLVLYYVLADSQSSAGDLDALVTDVAAYRQQLAADRRAKDEFFRTSADSPVRDKAHFAGLAYFPPDPAYRVVARLEPFADKTQKLVVHMSDGSEEVYEKYAHAVFSLGGQACRLLVVKLGDTYSILFRDATSGRETYGGGRYLELDTKQMEPTRARLDFNAAYNPYCAYAPGYACPLPPPENTLPVAVRAGERYVAHE